MLDNNSDINMHLAKLCYNINKNIYLVRCILWHWFKWLQYFNEDKEIIKSKNILVHSTTTFVDTKIVQYKGREPIIA